jgi:hypothetical protein
MGLQRGDATSSGATPTKNHDLAARCRHARQGFKRLDETLTIHIASQDLTVSSNDGIHRTHPTRYVINTVTRLHHRLFERSGDTQSSKALARQEVGDVTGSAGLKSTGLARKPQIIQGSLLQQRTQGMIDRITRNAHMPHV